jgi:hypothetical protein
MMKCSIDLMPTGAALMPSVQADFAGCRTDAAGEVGKIVGRMQDFQRLLPVTAVNQIVPVRNDVVDRTAVVAERNTAVHTTCALNLGILVGQCKHELLEILQSLFDRLVSLVETRSNSMNPVGLPIMRPPSVQQRPSR